MANKKVTVTRAYIDQLKSDRDKWKKNYDETKEDLDKHRNYWTGLLREVTAVHGRGNSVSAPWLIESMAKHFNKVKSWYWG